MTGRPGGDRPGTVIAGESPLDPDAAALIAELDAHLNALYPAEENFLLDPATLAAPDFRFFVARHNGAAVGCAALRVDAGEGYAEVKRMFVRPNARGAGVGRALLARLEAQTRAEGLAAMRLETGTRQAEALALYRTAGFRERGPFADYVPMPQSLFMEKHCETGGHGMTGGFTHFDSEGRAVMVDVSDKASTARTATARGSVLMQPGTVQRILDRGFKKGDVLSVARLAGIMGAKRTPDLIPLCHPLMLTSVTVDLTVDPARNAVDIEATCALTGQTGVEMEALTAVSVAALTVYDMCKAVDRGMTITEVRLVHKAGGKSGDWGAPSSRPAGPA